MSENQVYPKIYFPIDIDTGVCIICKKEMAVVDDLCIDCDHLQNDLTLDRELPTESPREEQ